MKRGEEDFPGRGQHVQRPCVPRGPGGDSEDRSRGWTRRGPKCAETRSGGGQGPGGAARSTFRDGETAGFCANLSSRHCRVWGRDAET